MAVCENGHSNEVTVKFCGECGLPLAPFPPVEESLVSISGGELVIGDTATGSDEADDAAASLGVPTQRPSANVDNRSVRNRVIAGRVVVASVVTAVLIGLLIIQTRPDDQHSDAAERIAIEQERTDAAKACAIAVGKAMDRLYVDAANSVLAGVGDSRESIFARATGELSPEEVTIFRTAQNAQVEAEASGAQFTDAAHSFTQSSIAGCKTLHGVVSP